MSPPAEMVMWVSEEVQAYAEGATTPCGPVPVPGIILSKGLRGLAHAAREACGPDWMWVRFDVPGYPPGRGAGWYVPTKALTAKAPPPAYATAPATGKAWVRQAGDRPTLAVPLDDPNWTSPALLSLGEPVERLGPRRIRSSTGQELWVDDYYLADTDPLLDARSAEDTRAAIQRRRYLAGLAAHTKGGPVAPLPPSDQLAKAPKGRAFVFEVDPKALGEPVYSADWFEPVGHTLTQACKGEPKPYQPCGTYRLDYSALGAWAPTKTVEVVAVWTGQALAVEVIEPWSREIGVSPAWDGRPDPRAATP